MEEKNFHSYQYGHSFKLITDFRLQLDLLREYRPTFLNRLQVVSNDSGLVTTEFMTSVTIHTEYNHSSKKFSISNYSVPFT